MSPLDGTLYLYIDREKIKPLVVKSCTEWILSSSLLCHWKPICCCGTQDFLLVCFGLFLIIKSLLYLKEIKYCVV